MNANQKKRAKCRKIPMIYSKITWLAFIGAIEFEFTLISIDLNVCPLFYLFPFQIAPLVFLRYYHFVVSSIFFFLEF